MIAARRVFMRGDHDLRQLRDDGKIEFALLRQAIERLCFIEAAQMNRPFDDLAAGSAELQAACAAPDRYRAEIEVRRVTLIDGDLVLAGGTTLFQRRKIHERKEDGPLDFVDVAAGEKNDRPMRVDARDRFFQPMRRRIREKGEDLALILGRVHGRAAWVGRDAKATARRKMGGAKIAPPILSAIIRRRRASASLFWLLRRNKP